MTPEYRRRLAEAPDGTPASVLREWWCEVGWKLNGYCIDHPLPYREIVGVVAAALDDSKTPPGEQPHRLTRLDDAPLGGRHPFLCPDCAGDAEKVQP